VSVLPSGDALELSAPKTYLELIPEEGTEPGSVSGEVDVHSIPE
jgi:hypothetical protein